MWVCFSGSGVQHLAVLLLIPFPPLGLFVRQDDCEAAIASDGFNSRENPLFVFSADSTLAQVR